MLDNENIDLANDEHTKELLIKFNESYEEYYGALQNIITAFKDQEIVQSFFASGKFGQTKAQKINDILLELKEYRNSLTEGEDSLIARTNTYLTKET